MFWQVLPICPPGTVHFFQEGTHPFPFLEGKQRPLPQHFDSQSAKAKHRSPGKPILFSHSWLRHLKGEWFQLHCFDRLRSRLLNRIE
jgi:hypothetical protein